MCKGISISQNQGQGTPPTESGPVKSPAMPAAITVDLVGLKKFTRRPSHYFLTSWANIHSGLPSQNLHKCTVEQTLAEDCLSSSPASVTSYCDFSMPQFPHP